MLNVSEERHILGSIQVFMYELSRVLLLYSLSRKKISFSFNIHMCSFADTTNPQERNLLSIMKSECRKNNRYIRGVEVDRER